MADTAEAAAVTAAPPPPQVEDTAARGPAPEPATAPPRTSRVRGTAVRPGAAPNPEPTPEPARTSRVRGTAVRPAPEPAAEPRHASRIRGTAVQAAPAAENGGSTSDTRGAAPDPAARPSTNPSPDPTVGSLSGSLDTDLDAGIGLSRANPHLLTEHALLGSLIHAPDGLNDMAKFLVGGDFSSRELGAVYYTVRGLAKAGELTEVSTLEDRTEQRWACAGNRMRVLDALVNQRFTTTPLADPEGLLLQLADAAPPETVPYRGVYDPSAQMRMARDVLADAIRRKVTDMGVRMQHRERFVRPWRTAARQELSAVSLHSKLETAQTNLNQMTMRWAQAVDRTGTNIGAAAATEVAAAAATARRPARPGPIAAFRLRRAERHLIHLALHTGHHLDGDIRPQYFTVPEHRNTWQLLMDIRERGEPVNRLSLYNETNRSIDIGPVMSHEDTFNKMRVAPETRPHRIASSLRTVVTAALNRAAKDAGAAVSTVAANRAVPVEGLLDYADQRVHGLMGRATTASAAHQKIADQHETGWSHTR